MIKSIENNDLTLGSFENPYGKEDFMKTVNNKKNILANNNYCFLGYIDKGIYSDQEEYLQITQKNPGKNFSTLGPNQVTMQQELITEVCKRNPDGTLPKNQEEITKSKPTFGICSGGVNIFVSLEDIQCSEKERTKINDFIYPKLEEYLKTIVKIDEENKNKITEFVLTTLAKEKLIKLPLGEKSKNGIKKTISALFTNIFASKKKESENVEPVSVDELS